MKPLFKHQEEVLERSKELVAFAIFWEQGTGKTRLALDSIRYQRSEGAIDAALIIAPNDVHRAWIEDEIPEWAPDFMDESYFWTSSKATTKAHRQMIEHVINDAVFPVMAIGYDGFMTAKGKEFCRRFFKKRRTYMVLDEASAIKTPAAKRSMSLVNAGRWVPFRRIMTGTPITTAPWNVWSMIKFLDPGFWPSKGIHTPTEFRTFFGVWEKGFYKNKKGELEEYPKCTGYRNLEILHQWLDEVSSRVEKSEVFDLPPKLYSTRYFEMTPEQSKAYRELKAYAMTILGDRLVTVAHKLTLLLRFSQILSNYLPTGDENELVQLGKRNPRLETLEAAIEEIGHQAIVFARFDLDVDKILNLLKGNSVRYDGRVGSDERARNKAAFLAGDVQFFVSKAAVQKGHTFVNAKTCVYYNNSFSLEDRLQSEDRIHRAGQDVAVNYIDIVCPETIDVHVVETLRAKKNLAGQIQGDNLREWI